MVTKYLIKAENFILSDTIVTKCLRKQFFGLLYSDLQTTTRILELMVNFIDEHINIHTYEFDLPLYSINIQSNKL